MIYGEELVIVQYDIYDERHTPPLLRSLWYLADGYELTLVCRCYVYPGEPLTWDSPGRADEGEICDAKALLDGEYYEIPAWAVNAIDAGDVGDLAVAQAEARCEAAKTERLDGLAQSW